MTVSVAEERARIDQILTQTVAAGGHAETTCACCGQKVAARGRAITRHMAEALLMITRAWVAQGREGWVAIKSIDVRGGDYAKLRYWGILEALPPAEKDPNQRDSAYWRPTAYGLCFAYGNCSAPKSVYVYNNRAVPNPRAKDIVIHDALADRFDWYKLMGITAPEAI